MIFKMLSAVFAPLSYSAVSAENPQISGERIRAHVQYLASDKLEGPGVGTNREMLATQYLATNCKRKA